MYIYAYICIIYEFIFIKVLAESLECSSVTTV